MTEPKSRIIGVSAIIPEHFIDPRGWLTELFRKDRLNPDEFPAMAYLSMTKPGISRGPHEHREQTDHICFTGVSKFRLYLWDNRPDSTTCKTHERYEIPPEQVIIFTIPPGVVHGYKNIGAVEGLIINFPNRLYAGENRASEVDEIRYEDDPETGFLIED